MMKNITTTPPGATAAQIRSPRSLGVDLFAGSRSPAAALVGELGAATGVGGQA